MPMPISVSATEVRFMLADVCDAVVVVRLRMVEGVGVCSPRRRSKRRAAGVSVWRRHEVVGLGRWLRAVMTQKKLAGLCRPWHGRKCEGCVPSSLVLLLRAGVD